MSAFRHVVTRASAFLLISLFMFLQPAGGQAQVTLSAAVNGASYLNSNLPNGKLARGVLFIAFGQGMGPASIQRASSFPLPTDLAGTSIRVTVENTTVDCIILYTISTQVAAVLPSNTPAGNGTMVLTFNGQSSAPLNITVVANSFGIFALNQGGSGPGVFTDPLTNAVNSLTRSANPTNLLDIWGTGLGAVSGNEAAGPLPGNIASADVEVYFGAQRAQIRYRGRSGCCAGVDQIRVVVPSGIDGCYVPVYVVVNGVASNFITVSIAQSGSQCSDPGGYSPELLQIARNNGGLRIGSIGLSRLFVDAGVIAYQGDAAFAGFIKIPLASLQQGTGIPVTNSCQVLQFPVPVPPQPTNLDAGPQVSMVSPMGNYNLIPPLLGSPFGQYLVTFSPDGFPSPGMITDGTVLQPGTYTFTGTGGNDVGPFMTSIELPVKFNWTNRVASGGAVNRGQPLTINWSNGYPGALVVINGQSQAVLGVGSSFSCWVDASAGTFTVPAAVLSALPPSFLDDDGDAQGSLSVFQLFNQLGFAVSGIDSGARAFSDGFTIGPVRFQ